MLQRIKAFLTAKNDRFLLIFYFCNMQRKASQPASGGFMLRPGMPRLTYSIDRPTHWKLRPTLRGSNISFCDEAQKCQKWHICGYIRCVFSSSKCTKTRSFRPGLCPGRRWGSLRRSPRPSGRLGRGHTIVYYEIKNRWQLFTSAFSVLGLILLHI